MSMTGIGMGGNKPELRISQFPIREMFKIIYNLKRLDTHSITNLQLLLSTILTVDLFKSICLDKELRQNVDK